MDQAPAEVGRELYTLAQRYKVPAELQLCDDFGDLS